MLSVRREAEKPVVTQLPISSALLVPPNWVPKPPCSSLALLFGRSAELENVDWPSEFQTSWSSCSAIFFMLPALSSALE